MRRTFIFTSAIILLIVFGVSNVWEPILWSLFVIVPLILVGVYDMLQVKQTIRRNFPVIGHFRYMLESIRPEIQQYFIERNDDGKPFSREKRSLIYQRSKRTLDTIPFGTQGDVERIGYEWVNHSILAKPPLKEEPRVKIGEHTCKQPYSASLLNISAMSYGALSDRAILALNSGARKGKFAHNTGEGSISPFHIEPGGDLIWQIGTGYFGCRNKDGSFCETKFHEKSNQPNVKMIEIKLSQGAKPGHGGILPAAKVTPAIATIRDVEIGRDVISPPSHSAFSNPIEMVEFIAKLRELSGGKPVGFKLCLGKRHEFMSICKAMMKTGIHPDFVAVDGGEGGTGAAPVEFSNSIGTPLNDGLINVHNMLKGAGLRSKVKVIASGKVAEGFHIASKLALGADLCYSARAMMFALGCIQALRCNNNLCPTGITTQDPQLVGGLDVKDKSERVYNFHLETVESFLEVLGAVGLDHPDELMPWHIRRRITVGETKHYGEIYHYLEDGQLLGDEIPESYKFAWANASAEHF